MFTNQITVADDISSEIIRDKLAELPLASPSSAISGMLELFMRFENVSIAPALHVELLSQAEPRVKVLMDILERRLINTSFPLERHIDADVVAMMNVLQLLIFSGQKLYHLLGKRKYRMLAEYIGRDYSRLYNLAFKTYKSVPEGFWSAFYHFMQAAQKGGFHIFNKKGRNCASSVSFLVNRILLLHLAAPQRLHHNELAMLESIVDEFAGELSVTEDKISRDDPAGLFYIDKNRNQPPRHVAFLGSEGEDIFLINTRLMLQALDAKSSELLKLRKNELAGLTRQALKNIMRRWWRVSKRSAARRKDNREVKIIFGFLAILQKSSNDHMRDLQLQEGGHGIEVIDTNSLHNPLIQPSWAGTSFDHTSSSESNVIPLEYNAHLVDRSATGYCIRWSKSKAGKIAVGSLIGVVDSGHTEIGITRWVMNASETEISFGLEVIAANFQAVSAYSHLKGIGDMVILLPAIPACNRPASLLCSANTFSRGDELVIVQPQKKDRAVKLKFIAERGRGYNVFNFEESSVDIDDHDEAEMFW